MNKLTFLLLLILSLLACNKLKSVNNMEVENGHGDKTKVTVFLTDNLDKTMSKDEVIRLVELASRQAELRCKHSPTYIPKTFTVSQKSDTLQVNVNFEASNSFGVSDSEFGFFSYLNKDGSYVLVEEL